MDTQETLKTKIKKILISHANGNTSTNNATSDLLNLFKGENSKKPQERETTIEEKCNSIYEMDSRQPEPTKVNQPTDKIGAEEILREIAYLAYKGAANAYTVYPDQKHPFATYWEQNKDQFESYASQFQKETVTDEKIEEWAEQKDGYLLDTELTDDELLHYKMGLADGAKAMRDGKIKLSK